MSTPTHKPATTSDILSNLSSEVLLTKEDPTIQDSNNPSSEALLAKEDPSSPSPAVPTNPSIRKSNNPFYAARARCGKVARLPKEIRDQLNEMLLDGIPHAQIIQKLKETFGPQSNVVPLDCANAEATSLAPSDGERAGLSSEVLLTNEEARGSSSAPDSDHPSRITHDNKFAHHHLPLPKGEGRGEGEGTVLQSNVPIDEQNLHSDPLSSLTPHHITTWKKFGGYRDWLKDQQRLQECKLRHELTLDLARSAEGLASYQAAPKVAVAQICQTIVDLGPEGLKDAMQASPLNCFRLLNALARLINSGLKCEHHIVKHAAETRPKMRNGFTPDVVETMENALNLF